MKFVYLLVVFGCLCLAGCVHSIDTVSANTYRDVVSLSEICGTYSNAGIVPSGHGQEVKLTDFLFPNNKEARAADAVRASLAGPTTIRCAALRGIDVLTSKDFVEGRDFHLQGGKIPLSARVSDLGSLTPGTGAVAVGTETRTLLFADTGDAILSARKRGGGLAMMIIPFGMVEQFDIIFRRIPIAANHPQEPTPSAVH